MRSTGFIPLLLAACAFTLVIQVRGEAESLKLRRDGGFAGAAEGMMMKCGPGGCRHFRALLDEEPTKCPYDKPIQMGKNPPGTILCWIPLSDPPPTSLPDGASWEVDSVKNVRNLVVKSNSNAPAPATKCPNDKPIPKGKNDSEDKVLCWMTPDPNLPSAPEGTYWKCDEGCMKYDLVVGDKSSAQVPKCPKEGTIAKGEKDPEGTILCYHQGGTVDVTAPDGTYWEDDQRGYGWNLIVGDKSNAPLPCPKKVKIQKGENDDEGKIVCHLPSKADIFPAPDGTHWAIDHETKKKKLILGYNDYGCPAPKLDNVQQGRILCTIISTTDYPPALDGTLWVEDKKKRVRHLVVGRDSTSISIPEVCPIPNNGFKALTKLCTLKVNGPIPDEPDGTFWSDGSAPGYKVLYADNSNKASLSYLTVGLLLVVQYFVAGGAVGHWI